MAVLPSVRDELEQLGSTDSVEGQVALALAEAIDHPRAGMALSPDSRELRQVMAAIRSAAPTKAANPIDDLLARRAARESASKAV